ncbi:recombinase family protein [Halomonas sp. MM17-34]|jgi:DNA invertase Pin-like site-specific DNA recombinase|uniref:recombinase family protein n=1 Tax=Halomonas sp. MM17-34 TaxID=2917742 RepID=UPI0023B797AC|nr:recombinase family protein [Halomonas sp. MM17-34]|tara:strand:- start:2247 stop:2909 length:663 start_codon:yes stop_codon:yes gene_type:complete
MRDEADHQTLDVMTGGLRIGYARVSTDDQDLSLQRDALQQSGCAEIYADTISGTKTDRPELTNCLRALRQGDTLVVWRLDRLGRSLKHLVEIINDLEKRGVRLESLTESIDTSTASGRMIASIFATLAEYERNLIRERTIAGLKAARARGRKGGRKPVLGPKEKREIEALLLDPKITVKDVAERYGVSRNTIYQHIDVKAINEAMNKKRIQQIMEEESHG